MSPYVVKAPYLSSVALPCLVSLSFCVFVSLLLFPLCRPLPDCGLSLFLRLLSPSAVLQAKKKVVDEEFEALVKQRHAEVEAEHKAKERGEL